MTSIKNKKKAAQQAFQDAKVRKNAKIIRESVIHLINNSIAHGIEKSGNIEDSKSCLYFKVLVIVEIVSL